jgi:hypothetical protein
VGGEQQGGLDAGEFPARPVAGQNRERLVYAGVPAMSVRAAPA